MSKTIKLENLGKELGEILETYQFKSKEDINDVTKISSRELRKLVQDKAPEERGVYKKAISVKKKGTSLTGVHTYVVYVKAPHYRLAHLLEKDHALAKGGRTRAFPHFKPGIVEIEPKFIAKLKERLSENR